MSTSGTSACENATQPASRSSPISVSVLPASCTVSAPIGYTCAWLSERARCLSISTRPGSSSGGSVSGGHARLVTPPAIAAAISDSSVALYSKPGSRSRAETSMRPGATTSPRASMTRLGVPPGRRRADRRDLARRDVERRFAIDAVGGIDQAAVGDLDLHAQVPAMMLITAIRTAMPNVTCGRITERSPSATAESISTPRFIGPGCMTITSGLASASFSCVRP